MDQTIYRELVDINQNTSETADLLRDLIGRIDQNNELLREIKEELARENPENL